MQSATQIPITAVMQQSLLPQAQCWRGCAASSSGAGSFASSPSPACLLLQGTVTLPHPSPSRRPGKAPGSGRHSTARYTTHHNASELTSEAGSWVWTLQLCPVCELQVPADRLHGSEEGVIQLIWQDAVTIPCFARLLTGLPRSSAGVAGHSPSLRHLLELCWLWSHPSCEQRETRSPRRFSRTDPTSPALGATWGSLTIPRCLRLLSLSSKAEILSRYFSFFCVFILALSLFACSSQQTSAPTCLLVKLCILSMVQVTRAAFPS